MPSDFVPIEARPGQEEYVKSIRENQITICEGICGTGKSILALNEGLKYLLQAPKKDKVRNIVIIRPYMMTQIGEKLGSLPGTLDEKVLPYVLSIKDNLRELVHSDQEIDFLLRTKFEFTILSMCRGRSFNNSFIIVDEAQNIPKAGGALKMLLTRVGKGSKLIIQGDPSQCDIRPEDSALSEAAEILYSVPGIGIVEMNEIETIQRSRIVKDIMRAYESWEKGN